MTVTGELALLPIVSMVRSDLPDGNRPRYDRSLISSQPRLYRLPSREKNAHFAYGPGGHTLLQDDKGRVIDLFV